MHRAAASIGAVKHCSTRHGHGIAAQLACQAAIANIRCRHRRGAVVGLGHASKACQCQGGGGDVGGGAAGGGDERIVGRISPAQAHAGHVDCFARAHIFIGEGCGAGNGEHVATNAVVAGGYGCRCAGVIGFVHAGVTHRERLGGNHAIAAADAGGAQRVVGCIGPGQCHAAHGVVQAGACVLAGIGAGAAHREHITTHLARQAEREAAHGGIAVIHLGHIGGCGGE